MTSGPDDLICLGVITGARGLKGEVKIKTFTQLPLEIAAYGTLSDKSGQKSFALSDVKLAKNIVFARITGVADRTQADALKGVELYVPRSRLPDLEEDTWYYADLIGLKALDLGEKQVGTVIAVHNFGAGELLELQLADDAQTIMLPFTEACVPKIDIKGGVIVIDPPETVETKETPSGG